MRHARWLTVLFFIQSPQLWSRDIIFDIFDVLVQIPRSARIKHTGIKTVCAYSLKGGKNPLHIKSRYFNTLAHIPMENEEICTAAEDATVGGIHMPPIMASWMAGAINYDDVLQRANTHLEQSNASKTTRKLFTNINKLNFDLEIRKKSYKLIDQSIVLLYRLAAEGHRLFILSNMDEEMMTHLQNTYPHVFNLFDDIVYSAQTKSLKPDPHIYNVLINKHQLNPANCVLLDNQPENINQALALGMDGILFNRHRNMAKKLEKKGLLTKHKS